MPKLNGRGSSKMIPVMIKMAPKAKSIDVVV